MNAKRLVYYELSQVVLPSMDPRRFPDWESSLCHFCQYANWVGSCEEADLDCEHPLNKVLERWDVNDVWSGDDCWGFRSDVSVDTLVEWISQRLQGQHVRLPFKGEKEEYETV